MSRALLLDAPLSLARDGADVITLSAGAEYASRRDGLAHRDLSDVALEDDFARLQGDYWRAQVDWFRLLEDRMVEHSPSLQASGWRPVWSAGYLLKLLLDNVFVRAYESDALCRGTWTEMVHITRPAGPRLLSDVLPLFCGPAGISYSREVTALPREERHLPGRVERATRVVRPLGHGALQVASSWPRRPSGGARGLRLLMLSRSYDSADLLRRNAAVGGTALLLAYGNVLEVRRGVPRRVARLSPPGEADRREWADVATALSADADLCAWPLSWFDGRVGPFVIDRLTRWITTTMPDIVAAARTFATVFETAAVDAVVAPFLSNATEIGAFTAANAADRTKSVLVEHGDIAHAAESWDLNLLAGGAVVVPTGELAGYLTARRKNYGEETGDVIIGSYRWPRYARLRDRSASRAPEVEGGDVDPRKPTLVYLVTALAADSRYLNNAWYPDAWYFRLQAAIIDALVQHERYNVVVKLFPVTEHDVSPLADYVADRKAPHLLVSRAPFTDWLPIADRVVVDMASTGLYESLVAGCPSLGLLWRNHPAREGAIAALGPALVPFSTPEEAAAAVDAFASARHPSMPDLKPEGSDILESLIELCQRP